VVGLLASPGAAAAGEFERGAAITDPAVLRELDLREHATARDAGRSLALAAMLGTAADASSADIFALLALKPLRAALDREFGDYDAKRHSGTFASNLQMFDLDALYSGQTRFILAGVVNRMDRAYKTPAACGEVWLIYRPIANYGVRSQNGVAASARLPMTLNLVLNVRNDEDPQTVTCAEFARRWLALRDMPDTGVDLASALAAKGGALEFVKPSHIARIETNIQIAHASANPNDFDARADYLMKVFNYDGATKSFSESPMENQIDREKLLYDAPLADEFREWLLEPGKFTAFDRGTVLIPDKFLATRAIVVTPAAESNAGGIFADIEVVEALAKAARDNLDLQNIKSPDGFARRLNDITCAGCHQTRSIGGFHFPGADWSGDAPSFVVTPASPHFFGDQPRRRDILSSFRDSRPLDFSRGFSARPQERRSSELDGTTYLNGWGAHCYAPDARATRVDKSFASWSCIDGLECQMPPNGGTATRSGLCFPE
jgi:hypothetical protein